MIQLRIQTMQIFEFENTGLNVATLSLTLQCQFAQQNKTRPLIMARTHSHTIEQCTHEKEKNKENIRSKQNPQQLSNSIHKKTLVGFCLNGIFGKSCWITIQLDFLCIDFDN